MSQQTQTIGQELMRVQFSGNEKVAKLKQMFAELFDVMTAHVVETQAKMEDTPKIHSQDAITKHMEVIKAGEELLRCMSEGGRNLEIACMWAVKGLTA